MLIPEQVWREYQRGVDYNNRIDLYDRVKTNENFFIGRQWEGLNVTTLDPLIFNVLRRVVNLFISMLVSDDISVTAQPFQAVPNGEQMQKVIDRSVASVIERAGVKSKNRYMLRKNADNRRMDVGSARSDGENTITDPIILALMGKG